MGHAVLKLIEESIFHELGCLESDFILEGSVIAQGEFLIEPFLTHTVLAFEGIECGYGEGQVRKSERVGTVPGVLGVQYIERQGCLSSKTFGEGDGG
jgi:hypothetical protein